MNKKTLILCLLIPLLVGGLSTFLIKDSIALYEALNKPLFYPPAWLFPIVWTILYLLTVSYTHLTLPTILRV